MRERIWLRRRRSVWFWVLVAVLLILLLGLFFGGYRKGTKVGAAPQPVVSAVTVNRPPCVAELFASLC